MTETPTSSSTTTRDPVAMPARMRWRCTNCGHIAEYARGQREPACCACGNASLRPA